ncbi:MAG: terminase small subunit protein [Beijerinckiaceae bacterium]|nr:terminase small subunit protein [Beijerinckiaceae bacterium]
MGRPSSFTQKTADIICERLANGESLRAITRDKDMPSDVTVMKWLRDFPEFLQQYVRARELQADAIFDECLDIADDSRNDWILRNGERAPDTEAIQRARLRIDTRKWMAGKLRPKKYGDKLDLTHAGADGGPIETKDVSLPQLARKIALILGRAATEKTRKLEDASNGGK